MGETSTAWLITESANRIYERFEASLRPCGLSPRGCGLLLALFDLGAIPQQAIRELLGIDKHAVVSLIDDLEGQALLTRTRDPADRRVQVLSLTTRGHELVADVLVDIVDRMDDRSAQALTGDERRQLRGVLGCVVRRRREVASRSRSHNQQRKQGETRDE